MDQVDDGILWEVVEVHLDEAEFQWSMWERGLTAPSSTVTDVAGVEARLDAHVQGLVLAAPAVVERLLAPALMDYQAHRAAAASWAWLAAEGDRALGPLCARLVEGDPPERRGIARALGLWDDDAVTSHVVPLLHHVEPEVQAAALEVLVDHGSAPREVVAALVGAASPALWRACIRAGVPAAIAMGLTGELGDDAFDLALWTGLQRRLGVAREAAWAAPERRSAAQVLGACGGERGLRVLLGALGDPRRCPAALWGLGFTGRREAADACARWLAHAELGSLAAEALAAISGLDLVAERMTFRRSDDDDDDDDDDVAPTEDDELTCPDPDRVGAWWQARRAQFDPHTRYLHGAPATAATLAPAFERASMRRRPGLAIELALRTRGAMWVDPRSFTARQRRALVGVSALRLDLTAAILD